MTRKNWLAWRAGSKRKPAHYLEHRTVYCADCEERRSLASQSGVLACSACGSQQWVHVSPPYLPSAKTYDEATTRAQRVVERNIERLKKEVFFSPEVSLV
jgi:ribosomal protein L37AE/L43A